MTQLPATRRVDAVDVMHGVAVSDPYRWLEDATTDEVRRWIEAQNAVTRGHLDGIVQLGEIRTRLAEIWDHPRRGAPWHRGERWFQLRNDGLQDQDVLWTMGAPDARGRVLLDPNDLSEDGTVALTRVSVRDDGAMVAYGLSEGGSDWVTWHVRDVETGEDLEDEVRWSKFTAGAWLPDGSGFIYGYYDPPEEGDEHAGTNRDHQLRLHVLGAPQEDDRVVLARPDEPEWGFEPRVTHDGRWLIVTVSHGTQRETRLHAVRLRDDGGIDEDPDVIPVIDEGDARYEVAGTDGDVVHVTTDLDAPRGRVVAIELTDPDRSRWREVVPEGGDTLERARIVGGTIVTVELHHARHRVRVHDLDGAPRGEVTLPGMATVGPIAGREDERLLHLTAETFTAPQTVLAHDVSEERTEIIHAPDLPTGASAELVATQVHVTGADGTRIPLFLVHRDDVRPDGEVPTLLWGYGGFDIPVTPTFKAEWAVWAERGGLVAVACLRGGGEYGREWHDAGRLANKQNVFDDFAACAEWLAGDGGWTRRERLAITGRSNGGLLVGAAITQRPELYGAAVPEVGVLDMLRFHRFTIGWGWASDYGSADDPEDFERLLAYSPYHNVVEGTCYPPTLVTTGDTDDRVVPAHSFKFAAALQAAQDCDAPVLIRVDTSAGHGIGKPTSKLVDERADVLAFMTRHTRGSTAGREDGGGTR